MRAVLHKFDPIAEWIDKPHLNVAVQAFGWSGNNRYAALYKVVIHIRDIVHLDAEMLKAPSVAVRRLICGCAVKQFEKLRGGEAQIQKRPPVAKRQGEKLFHTEKITVVVNCHVDI